MSNKIKLMGILMALSTAAMGVSIDHIQTYSPEYLGNQAQNGMINNSSVYYNPAGTTKLEDGLYFQAGGQMAVGYERMEYNGTTYKARLQQPIPNFALYKVENHETTFWTFGGLGGGGDLKYNHGVAGTAVVPDLVNSINSKVMAKTARLGGIPALSVIDLQDDGSSAEGKNIYGQTTIGRAWEVNNKLSVSLAGRLVYGYKKLDANLNMKGTPLRGDKLKNYLAMKPLLEAMGKNPNLQSSEIPGLIAQGKRNVASMSAEQFDNIQYQNTTFASHIHSDLKGSRSAWGYGVQLGLNYKATEKLNLAMRYDSRVKLNFKAKGHQRDVVNPFLNLNIGFGNFYPEYQDGVKSRRDLPAILALGASYKVTPDWTMAIAGNYYFNKDAKMDRLAPEGNIGGKKFASVAPKYKNGYEIALGTEYAINEKVSLLGSINYGRTGAQKESFDDVEYAVDSTTLGVGVKYKPTPDDEILLTACHFGYKKEEGHYNIKYKGLNIDNPKYHKSITAVGMSYTHRF